MTVRPTLRRSLIYVLPLALLLVAVTARIAASDLLERLSLFCFDLYQKAAPREPEDAPIRIVDIDDQSLSKLGQWPWPRTVVAQLVDRLREAGAAVVAFDIDFAEPDRTSPRLLLPLLAQNGVGAGEAEKLLAEVPDPDRRLAEAIGTVPVVTGFILTDRGDTRPPLPKAGFAFVGDDPLGHVDSFPAAVANLPGMAFSTNIPTGTTSFAGFRWFCGSATNRIPRSPPRHSDLRSTHVATSGALQEQIPRIALARRQG
jgi:adenylate cyclase